MGLKLKDVHSTKFFFDLGEIILFSCQVTPSPGPISDTTQEISYEEMNSMQVCASLLQACLRDTYHCQNSFADPGQGIYFKGFAHSTLGYRSTRQAWEKMQEVTKVLGFTKGDHLDTI